MGVSAHIHSSLVNRLLKVSKESASTVVLLRRFHRLIAVSCQSNVGVSFYFVKSTFVSASLELDLYNRLSLLKTLDLSSF